ncbi:hypothetical protein GQ44DRAFT_270319 [Phaeosphaeriaceae sp. PMI808]|nr:hypothetical protein GQ44DRAFT_270319 [Phaeosphaeriaceae sp. PMI808]
MSVQTQRMSVPSQPKVVQTQRQKLRGKSGCLTCRGRRKKCDEQTPVCSRCASSGRACEWPSLGQMVDRRYATHPNSRYGSNTTAPPICYQSENTFQEKQSRDLEVIMSRHFIDKFFAVIVLPESHSAFVSDWITKIQSLWTNSSSVRFAVLANASSHLHNYDANTRMQSLALNYYSKSVKGLSDVLVKSKNQHFVNSEGFLISIILLYVHGCVGRSTYNDNPPHLSAAMRLMRLRCFDKPQTVLTPFDRFALESVLFQMFFTSMGYWSDQKPVYEFDLSFWLRSEELLANNPFPGTTSFNSPILGLPLPLFRLVIQAKQVYRHPELYDSPKLARLRSEARGWEARVLGNLPIDPSTTNELPSQRQQYYEAAGYLHVLIISLLLKLASKSSEFSTLQVSNQNLLPSVVPSDTWQLKRALHIIRAFEYDSGWTSCFVGTWAVYTIGFFLNNENDIELIRGDLRRRWSDTKLIHIEWLMADLEVAWKTHRDVLTLSDTKESSESPEYTQDSPELRTFVECIYNPMTASELAEHLAEEANRAKLVEYLQEPTESRGLVRHPRDTTQLSERTIGIKEPAGSRLQPLSPTSS